MNTISSKVSVIIPAYNREKTIKYCIDSVLHQSIEPYEIIIVDDCSSDKTVSIVNSYKNKSIKCISLKQRSGAQAARNEGIKNANGEWIAFQDSDDEWLFNKLEKQLEEANTTGYKVIHCGCYIQKDGVKAIFVIPELSGNVYKRLLTGPGPTFPGLFVKKECLEYIDYLDEKVPSFQEWDTSIRLSQYYDFGFVPNPLFIYHIHDGEAISKNPIREAEGMEYIVNKHMDEIIKEAGIVHLIEYYRNLLGRFKCLNNDFKIKLYKRKILKVPLCCLIHYVLYKIKNKLKYTLKTNKNL